MNSLSIRRVVWMSIIGALLLSHVAAAEEATFRREEQVIYGRKDGLAMTMDVFTPAVDANGIGIVATVSGGWFSGQQVLKSDVGRLPSFFNGQIQELLSRGYTVFAVVHGSQPKYTIPEIREDMHRAVRYIRHKAEKYEIDPQRIGIFGGSAGGHLSLMQGTAGTEGDANAEDPVDRKSSRVQAVISYYPPTDFLNYKTADGYFDKYIRELLNGRNPFLSAIDFHDRNDDTGLIERVEGEAEIRRRLADNSPVNHVSKDDPPTLIIHGDADQLVPIQQAILIMAKFKEAGVTASLKTMPGKQHGWVAEADELSLFADWFEQHLLKDADAEP